MSLSRFEFDDVSDLKIIIKLVLKLLMFLRVLHAQRSSVVQREQHEYDAKKKHQEPQSCLPIYLCRVLI